MSAEKLGACNSVGAEGRPREEPLTQQHAVLTADGAGELGVHPGHQAGGAWSRQLFFLQCLRLACQVCWGYVAGAKHRQEQRPKQLDLTGFNP